MLLSCLGTLAGPAQLGAAPREDLGESADAAAMTMRMARRLGPYRIGMERRIFKGLIRTIRQPRNDGPGCSGSFLQDSHIDVYPGLRLGYVTALGGRKLLDTIATSRKGDRTSVGFTIGSSTRADVRRRYPGLRVWRHRGGSTITLWRQTGYESHEYLDYNFDSSHRLVRLETGVGGC
jgi:hypothetical protein